MRQSKRVALLVYLAVHAPGGFARRDQLLALLWPEEPDRTARRALNQAVYYLRQSLGSDLILGRGGAELGVDPARLGCDAVRFDQELTEGRPKQALGRYLGPFLDGFHVDGDRSFADWAHARRQDFHSRAVQAARDVIRQAHLEEDRDTVSKWARWMVRNAGADEVRLREGLQALDRIGDRAGALAAFEDFSSMLLEGFDARPSPETLALADEIRQRTRSNGRSISEPDSEQVSQDDHEARLAPAERSGPSHGDTWNPNVKRRSRTRVGLAFLAMVSVAAAIFAGMRTPAGAEIPLGTGWDGPRRPGWQSSPSKCRGWQMWTRISLPPLGHGSSRS